MTEYEICYSYRTAKHKARQIHIIAELNGIKDLEVIKTLTKNGEKLPERTVEKLFKQLDELEEQIKAKEREYREIVEALTGGSR